jgi:hypothetical protein
MTLSNWILLGLLVAIIIAGVIIKHKSKKAVSDIDGFNGISRKSEMRDGVAIGKFESSESIVDKLESSNAVIGKFKSNESEDSSIHQSTKDADDNIHFR